MRRFLFHPLDTLFFRDGRPFQQDDEGMADVRSLFPPFPGVLGGAFRAALARAQGWDGRVDWMKELPAVGAVLGDGADPGLLTLGTPAVLQAHGGGWRRLYPAPQHLLAGGTPQCSCLAFVAPGPAACALRCDLETAGSMRLPQLLRTIESAKPLAGKWLSPAGMENVLDGRWPGEDDIIAQERLWQHEFRVGLQRDSVSRTAVPGMLYAASFVRLKKAVALGLEVDGLDPTWQPQSLALLGGAQRLVEIECGDWREAVHQPVDQTPDRFVVVLTGPMKPEGAGWRTPNDVLDPELPDAKVVAACVDRQVMIGGWDSQAGEPRPLQPYLPAGSVFFLEGAPPGQWPAALGQDTKQGYGRYLVGRWPKGGSP